MLFDTNLKSKLATLLAPICDADPDVLADYVIALLRHDKSEQELKQLCISQLEDFLKHETIPFVDTLFGLIGGGQGSSGTAKRKIDSPGLPVVVTAATTTASSSMMPPLHNNSHNHQQSQQQSAQKYQKMDDYSRGSNKRFVAPISRKTGQRCRDYDEKGVCLRGDLCPYEHGADRIVVDETTMMHGRPFGMSHSLDQSSFGGNTAAGPRGFDRGGSNNIPAMYNRGGYGQHQGRDRGSPRNRGGPGRNHSAPNQSPILVVEKIPLEACTLDKINDWFKQFGTIVNIQVTPNMYRAIVQYTQLREAQAAYKSPEAVFGNRFVKVYWHRVDDEPLPIPSEIPAFQQQQQQAPSTGTFITPSSSPITSLSPSPDVERKRKEQERIRVMLDLQKQKEQLIQRQLQHQKALMKKLEDSPSMSAADKAAIMRSIKSIGESTKDILSSTSTETTKLIASIPPAESPLTMNATTEAIDPALAEKLEELKKQAIADGIDPVAVTAINTTNTTSISGGGFYSPRGGRGGWRGGRGGSTPVANRSFRLDNRPAKFYLTAPKDVGEDQLRTHFGSFGTIKNLQDGCIEFENRRIAETAYTQGSKISGVSLGVTWTQNSLMDSPQKSLIGDAEAVSTIEASTTDKTQNI